MRTCYVINEYRAIADLCDARDMGLPGMLLTRVSVPAGHRGKKVGSALLKLVLDAADAEGVRLWLEVQPSGPLDYKQLVAWYERNGFVHSKYTGVYTRAPK